jgi:hypothetical protein
MEGGAMLSKLQFIPINDKKIPLVKNWQTSSSAHDLTGCYGVGLVCGKLSSGVEVLDIDLKYDISGTLYKKFKDAVHLVAPGLLNKLTVVKTVSGGYHWIYRCTVIQGNLKLAQRYATGEEQISGEKVKVLIETRGEGGYIATVPTKGYDLVYGSLETIQDITPEEREILLNCAREFNEVLTEFKPTQRQEKKQIKGKTPFEDYNERGDVVALLTTHGWTPVKSRGSKILMKRPGSTTAAHSGNFDTERNHFSVFSTSTEFEPQTAYLPYAVFAYLECKKDFPEASRKLYELGYGDRRETAAPYNTSTPSRVDLNDDDLSFVSQPNETISHLNEWRSGTYPMGKTTGFSEVDQYFRFKENNLVIINGLDNVGKSTVIWYMALLSNLLHGWKWIIYSAENSEGTIIRKLIEFYWNEPIHVMNELKFKAAKAHIENNFVIIKSDDELYNYKDILMMAKKVLNKKGKHHALMIDPYNALKMDLPRGLSTHDFHYEAISDIKLFTKRNNICIYLNCHVVTPSTRTIQGQNTVSAPKKADTEGGAKFGNKADDFLTIHRDVADPIQWIWTQIHVRKIKETETGGRVTPYDSPVLLRACKGLTGFETAEGFNPILEYHKNGSNVQVKAELKNNDDFLTNPDIIINNDDTDFPF